MIASVCLDLEKSRFILKEMSQETYLRFQTRNNKEIENITKQPEECKPSIPNPDDAIQTHYIFPLNSHSSHIGKKKKLLFP
jgi:hypothetical protein